MPTRNVATYAAIPIPQRARADEELTRPLAWWQNSELCYKGFSPRRSHEVDRVYLTFLFKATFLINYYFFDIYFSVLQAECSLTEVLN